MQKYMIVFILALAFSITFANAQLRDEDVPTDLRSSATVTEDSNSGKYYTRSLPDWSIKNEVKTIEKSLSNYDPLIQSLEEANSDLKGDLEEYLKNPGNEVLAAKITAKMSQYAKKIVTNVDTIVSDQDNLITVFNELNQKLDKFSTGLESKVIDLEKQVKQYQDESKELEQQLRQVAKRWKDAPPEEKEKFKQEFQRLYNKYNINSRYREGFERNCRDYQVLTQNLKNLMKVFKALKISFETLLENLEAEKKYLIDTIALNADAIRVRKLVYDGVTDGHKAVVGITKKLALLYTQVDGFAKVHEKINRDMAKFSDTSKILGSLVEEINKAPYQPASSCERALEFFANSPEGADFGQLNKKQ